MVQASLEAGVPVIVEKPGATSPEAYAPLVELADSKGLLLAMSLIETAPVREATRLVSEGQLGRVYSIQYLLSDHQRWEGKVHRPGGRGNFITLLQESIDHIRGNGPPPIANDAGLRFLEIQHALYRASETGQTQRLEA